MHDLQSVLLWKSIESFAWLADTAAPQLAQTSPDCGAPDTEASGVGGALGAGSGAVAGGLMHVATAVAACSATVGIG